MPPGQAWLRPSRIRVRFLPPIGTAGLGPADVDRLRERTRERIATALSDGGPC